MPTNQIIFHIWLYPKIRLRNWLATLNNIGLNFPVSLNVSIGKDVWYWHEIFFSCLIYRANVWSQHILPYYIIFTYYLVVFHDTKVHKFFYYFSNIVKMYIIYYPVNHFSIPHKVINDYLNLLLISQYLLSRQWFYSHLKKKSDRKVVMNQIILQINQERKTKQNLDNLLCL